MTISLVIADDHPLVLDGLESLIRSHPELQLLARCTSGKATLAALRTHRPDVLILDLRMPDGGGLAVLEEMKTLDLPTHTVVLPAALEVDEVIKAIRFGVRGVVLKEMAPELLVRCIHRVYEGGLWLERSSIAEVLDSMIKRDEGEREVAGVLTPREIEVMRYAARGMRNKEIARTLGVNEGTVKIHLHNIYEKLGLDGRVALTLYANAKGLG